MTFKPPLSWRILPRRTFSRWTGRVARVRWPGFLLRPVMRWYAKRYGANLDEAARPLRGYRSFVDFFTRELRDGARPLPEDPEAIACPCDGQVSMAGRIEDGMLLQVKGYTYSLAELLGKPEEAAPFQGGSYAVLYLAPGDYHRFHWPFDGTIRRVRHIRGDLWPVNERSVESVEHLFVRNERVVCLGETAGGGAFAYVAVGALNVGGVKLAFHDLKTNRRGRVAAATWPVAIEGRRGEELGRFELGSTLVLVLASSAGHIDMPGDLAAVRMGQPVGLLSTTTASER